MKTLLKFKRYILVPSLLAAAAALLIAIPMSAKQPNDVQSPENSGKKTGFIHNGHQICVGVAAAPAHEAHGDTATGPCTGGG